MFSTFRLAHGWHTITCEYLFGVYDVFSRLPFVLFLNTCGCLFCCVDFVLQFAGLYYGSLGCPSRVVWFICARSAATRLACTGCLPFWFHRLDVDGIWDCVA
jgi:hypothetical protein